MGFVDHGDMLGAIDLLQANTSISNKTKEVIAKFSRIWRKAAAKNKK